MSVRLAAAGAADDGGGLAGAAVKEMPREHRVLGAGVAELHVPELDVAARGRIDDRRLGVVTEMLGVEHLLDALGRRRGPRHHDEHEGRHEHRDQDLHDVRS